MEEWFVEVMKKVIEACYEYLKDQVKWQTGMLEELQRLRDIQPTIQAVVSAYNEAQIEDSHLNEWLWQLRDAVDEADDVLDEIEYWKHVKQVSENKKLRKARSLLKSLKKRTVKIGKRAFKIDSTLKRLEVAVQKLDKISTKVSTFHPIFESRRQEQQQQQLEMREIRETGAMPKNNLVGRNEEMEFVKQWLRNPYQTEITNTDDFYRNISLLSVVGHGGMGKTTLLQNVYEVTEEFDVKVWVCVSDNFNAKTVIKNILESLIKEKVSSDALEILQMSLKSEVKSKRFLLVLDDIWEDDKTEKWENVLTPLSHGSSGSKILITTRMNSVALMFAKMIEKSMETLQLKGLKEDQCLQLLNKHAFAGEKNPDVHKRLKSITQEMVKKISGCPLVAKVIGSMLNFKLDESYWTKVLNTDIHNVNPQNSGQNVLLPILKLSYIYLPKYLQNCFTFCCIFPKDHEFDKDDLVRMWIALGFIQSSNIQGETFEEIGGRYFDTLVKKSFFDEFNGGVYYKMHHMLHELAKFVSTQECARVVDDRDLLIPQTIRHLSVQTSSLKETFKKIGELKNLRSLFLSSNEANYDENFMNLLSRIFKASKSIRLLSITAPNLKNIPKKISCLIHLRYLKLESKRIFKLPRSISHLYHLQFIISEEHPYTNSYAHDFLPRDINNLYNLRYLRLSNDDDFMIYEIGKLKSLQRLDRFYVKKGIGYGIGELEHMNELRQIGICQLENINDAKEACGAKFCDKINLTDLSLDWGGGFRDRRDTIVDQGLDEKVLDSIQPNNNLKRLCINEYMGVRSANWMKDVCFTSSNLEYIRLENCLKWKTLPPFGQLPSLKSLYLFNMPEVEKLDHNNDCMFPMLKVLDIYNLQALQEWFDTTLAENGCLLPCLTELRLKYCPKLQELPSLPTKLQKLEMDSIGWKSCKWLRGIRNCSRIDICYLPNLIQLRGRQELKTNENWQLIMDRLIINDPSVLLVEPLRSISSLRFLSIEENNELVSFPIGTEQWFLQLSSSLYRLGFQMLQSLESLPSCLESLSSLNTLYVFDVPLLKLLPKLPSSLERLELYDVESLQCLPSCLSTISSLKYLFLRDTPHLKSLPDLPSSLQLLQLRNLHSLQCMPSSLSTISSLNIIRLYCIPLLKSLPDLPSSLEELHLEELENLDCLPSCLPTLNKLCIIKVTQLLELPGLPDSLSSLSIKDCHPQLMERYKSF